MITFWYGVMTASIVCNIVLAILLYKSKIKYYKKGILERDEIQFDNAIGEKRKIKLRCENESKF